MATKPQGAAVPSPVRAALGWSALLGLVSAATACHLAESQDRPDYPANHPCQSKSNCDYYLQLADGGAAEVPEGGTGTSVDGVRMCGPCNG